MMAVSPTSLAPVAGTVEAVNPKGIKIAGAWHNFSRFAEDLVIPERGQDVTLTVDKAGFVRTVTVTDGADVGAAIRNASPPASADRDRTITRLAVLKAAAEFGAARPGLKSGEVLRIAESWERWVLRPDAEPHEDLMDAF
jgi:hypothetical protein